MPPTRTILRVLSASVFCMFVMLAPLAASAAREVPKCVWDNTVTPQKCISLADCQTRAGTPTQVACAAFACADFGACPGFVARDTNPAPQELEDPKFVFTPINPRLQIEIPTLKFSELYEKQTGETRTVTIPWIGQYIAAVYRWAVPFGAILATIVIMIAGVIWLTSTGAGQLSRAREIMANAVIGLLLLVGSYVVLNLINPDLVTFTDIQVQVVAPQRVAVEEDEQEVVTMPEPTGIATATGPFIIGAIPLEAELLPALQAAAQDIHATSGRYQLLVASGLRTEQRQRELIQQNCQNPVGAPTCRPKKGRPITCMLTNGPGSCAHTSGRALDVWGATERGAQCIKQKQCLADRDACRRNPCQAAAIDAMRRAGFCNLRSEPWHFEQPGPAGQRSNGCT